MGLTPASEAPSGELGAIVLRKRKAELIALLGRSSGVILVVASQFASVDTIPNTWSHNFRQKFFSALRLRTGTNGFPRLLALGLALLVSLRLLFM